VSDDQLATLRQILADNPNALLELFADLKKSPSDTQKPSDSQNAVYIDKEYLYEGRQDCFIYRDNRTKNKNYYIHVWDSATKKRFTKSLRTTKREIAIAEAGKIYAETRHRLGNGVKLTSLTAKDLVREYQNLRRKEITIVPHAGITPRSFNTLCRNLEYWEKYIAAQGFTHTKLENIPPEVGIGFGLWVKEREKKAAIGKPRSNGTINHIIAATKKMYRDVAIDQKYITQNEFPRFRYLKVSKEREHTKDILTRDEFTAVSRFMQYKWCNENGLTENEKIKRRVYALTFTIHYYSGCRTKELLGIRWNDITMPQFENKSDPEKINRRIHIPKENSKTGRSRMIIAPIAPQLERLRKWYTQYEYTPKDTDYVFQKMTKNSLGTNTPQTDKSLSDRVREVTLGADAAGYIDLRGRTISNYCARHFYITDALLRGVDIYDIAQNAGTSVQYIESTYSKVTVDMKAEDITKNLGGHRMLRDERDIKMDLSP
jgi:integrase